MFGIRFDDYARAHHDDLRRAVHHGPPRKRRRPPRQRVGWLLVEVGLRLAAAPG